MQCTLVSMRPCCVRLTSGSVSFHTENNNLLGSAVSPWMLCSMGFHSIMWKRGSMRFYNVTMDPWFHKALLCQNGPLVPQGPTVSPWSPWIHIVTMGTFLHSMQPRGVTVTPWLHEFVHYQQWFHCSNKALQCNNGLLVP